MPAFTMSSTMRCVSHAVGEAGFMTIGTPEIMRGRCLLAQAPGRKIEGVDENRRAFRGSRKCCAAKTLVFRKRDPRAFFQDAALVLIAADLCVDTSSV